MANSSEVMTGITKKPGITYSVLTPNARGLEDALSANSDEVAVFAAVTETFSQRNTNCSMHESLQRIETVVKQALAAKTPVRGYLSCVLGCPYEGSVNPDLMLYSQWQNNYWGLVATKFRLAIPSELARRAKLRA